MSRTLTARGVDGLKPTPGKRTEHFDDLVPGLALRITERGHKSWSVLYRHRGRLRRLTLGPASAIALAEARERARDAIADAAKGNDPAATKRARRGAETVDDLARDYIERHAKPKKRSWKEDDRILRAAVLPAWRGRAIADITRRDVRLLVQAIADRGAPIMANRTAALLSKVFRFALDEELVEHNPAARITRPGAERRRERVFAEDEIRRLWQSFDAMPPEMGAYFKLRLVTAQRGQEVRALRWQDIDGAWWTIPGSVAKNGLPHRVPLSPLALAILSGLSRADVSTGYVLAGARGKRQQGEAAAAVPVPDFRGHDLRRTAASHMASGGVARLTIKKILNHVDSDVTAIYDRHGYDAEKVAALNFWGEKLSFILESKSAQILRFSAAS